MLCTRVIPNAFKTSYRLLHTTTSLRAADGHDPRLSQGHLTDSSNLKKDPQSDSARSGFQSSNNQTDSASKQVRKSSNDGLSGNQEKVGFAEQVGSHSTGKSGGSKDGTEDAQPPGLFGTIKKTLGFKTDAGDVKQNKGGGAGVTGTGSTKGFHTSALRSADSTTTGQAPEKSKQPKDDVVGDQNAHLKHKNEGEPDKGKGNAGEKPELPSKREKHPGSKKVSS